MQIPKEACPITYERVMHQVATYGNDQDWDLFGSDDGSWEDIRVLACAAEPTPETVRLRAFFAIELMYCELLPRQIVAVQSIVPVKKDIREFRLDRSEQGLMQLGALSDAYAKKVSANATIIRLKGAANTVQSAHLLSRIADSFREIATACGALGHYLQTGERVAAAAIGSNLAKAIDLALIPTLEEEQLLRTLLSVNESNPMHAWERR